MKRLLDCEIVYFPPKIFKFNPKNAIMKPKITENLCEIDKMGPKFSLIYKKSTERGIV